MSAAKLNVLSLFAGIEGFGLGLERAGMTVVGQVEIDEYKRSVLAKHWPDVPHHDDVRTAVDWWRSEQRPRVDVVCGGFPCQDISSAGQRAGIDGVKSGLWAPMAEVVRALRPRYVVVENTPALLVRGMGRVVDDLARLGYDAEWDCIPAAALGAPHIRARLWILAYPRSERGQADHALQAGWPQPELRAGWAPEPAVGRVVDGIPRRLAGPVNRANGALGDAVVPQVAEYVGRLIVEHYESERAA